jgi:hypothetical protein
MYIPHPNPELQELFARKPHQGADPRSARYLFVGLDANYDPSIDRSAIFPMLREYHCDGAAFWRQRGVHHPFLLAGYTGDGRHYHRSFSRIGFEPEHADVVSFIELLHVATMGRSRLAPEDLDRTHLEMLNDVILASKPKRVFIPAGVARLMRATESFPWLPRAPSSTEGPLGVLYRDPTTTVYSHLHFSVYGKFERRKVEEAAAIREMLARDA